MTWTDLIARVVRLASFSLFLPRYITNAYMRVARVYGRLGDSNWTFEWQMSKGLGDKTEALAYA